MRLLCLLAVTTLWTYVLAWGTSGISCSSCGLECQDACGTRHFRACCFNFQRRKKSTIPARIREDPHAERFLQRLEWNLISPEQTSKIKHQVEKKFHSEESPPMDIAWFPEATFQRSSNNDGSEEDKEGLSSLRRIRKMFL